MFPGSEELFSSYTIYRARGLVAEADEILARYEWMCPD